MLTLLRRARAWILAVPLTLSFIGAASNQAVIYANHDRFPVMLNSAKVTHYEPDADGMIDKVHSVMQPTDHLKFLADWIDLGDGMYSPGDLLLMLGDWLWTYAPLVWAICLLQFAFTGKFN